MFYNDNDTLIQMRENLSRVEENLNLISLFIRIKSFDKDN